jgi:hypothetical protein
MEVVPSIEINIAELVLHGFVPGDKYRISEAIGQSLIALFKEKGIPSSLLKNNNQRVIDAGSFIMAPTAQPVAIGNLVAGSIFTAFDATTSAGNTTGPKK